MIFHLLYISEKSQHFKPSDIEHTGLLINKGAFFIQLLEGKKENVMRTYHRISSDHRHFRIRILFSGNSESRLFPEWAMGNGSGRGQAGKHYE